jgi:hypothetical protein
MSILVLVLIAKLIGSVGLVIYHGHTIYTLILMLIEQFNM